MSSKIAANKYVQNMKTLTYLGTNLEKLSIAYTF